MKKEDIDKELLIALSEEDSEEEGVYVLGAGVLFDWRNKYAASIDDATLIEIAESYACSFTGMQGDTQDNSRIFFFYDDKDDRTEQTTTPVVKRGRR